MKAEVPSFFTWLQEDDPKCIQMRKQKQNQTPSHHIERTLAHWQHGGLDQQVMSSES